MFTTLAVAARDRKRLAEISGVAARFGLEAVLLRLADLVDAEFQDLALLDVIEMGRPITAAMGLRGMLQRSLRHFAGAATAIHGQTLSNSFPVDLLSYTLKEPVGVVGAIIPWNGPLFSAAWKIGPVLATGCTIVLKPAEDASLSPLRFAELCLEAGVPPDALLPMAANTEEGDVMAVKADSSPTEV